MVTTGAMPVVPSFRAPRHQGLTLLGCLLAPVRTCGRPGGPADRAVRPAGEPYWGPGSERTRELGRRNACGAREHTSAVA